MIALLLLASVLSAVALSAGVAGQRHSGNDLRERIARHAAEAALAQGIEAIHADPSLIELDADWSPCAADDTGFPCGAVPSVTQAGAPRRATMFRYLGGHADVFAPGGVDTLDAGLLPLARTMAARDDGLVLEYGVGAVMCRVAPALPGAAATCSTDPAQSTRLRALTLVAIAGLRGEAARSTVSKSVVAYTLPGLATSTPTLVASGPVDLGGALEVAPSPRAGGIAAWSRRDIDTGSCVEGTELLDVDLNQCGENLDVAPGEFPCDLFEHVFGVRTHRDESPVDGFCETPITIGDPEGGATPIGLADAFLAEQADWVIPGNGAFDARFNDGRAIACDQLDASRTGIVWDRSGTCGDGKTLGRADAPVIFVTRGARTLRGFALHGVLLVLGSGEAPLSSIRGGDAVLRLDADSEIRGVVVVQGSIERTGGQASLRYDETVMSHLAAASTVTRVAGLPGSWRDAPRY